MDQSFSSTTPIFRTVLVECKSTSSLESLIETIVVGLLQGVKPTGILNLSNLLPFFNLECRPIVSLHQIHLLPASILSSLLHCLARYTTKLGLVLIMTTSTATGVLREVLPSSVRSHLNLKTLNLMDGDEIWENIMSDVRMSVFGTAQTAVLIQCGCWLRSSIVVLFT